MPPSDTKMTLGDRHAYVGATLKLLAGLIGSCIGLPVMRAGNLRDGLAIALGLVLVVGWMVLSYSRARAARLPWLVIAPIITLLGGYAIMVAFIEGDAYYQGNGPWWLWLVAAAALAGIPALFAWPAAWVTLAVIKDRRAAT